jgi:AraC family transcriptional activator of pobA
LNTLTFKLPFPCGIRFKMKTIPVKKIKGTKSEPDLSESFIIRDVSELLGGKDLLQELHRHDFFYLLALKKGKGNHEIDFTPYTVHDNSIFIMRPGQVHQHLLKAKSQGHLIQFKTDLYHSHDNIALQLLSKASSVNHYQLDASNFKKLHALLENILQEYNNKHHSYQQVIKANLEILFIELVRQHSKITAKNITTYTQERLEKFLELLETHITAHKQVTEYASMLSLSPYQLNAITNAALGKTCSELINEYIILEAKRYLLATTNQVNQIAYHLGYEDASYFIRFFKKHAGTSPDAFRNNFK